MADQSGEPMLVNTGDASHPTPIHRAILDGYAPGNELYTFQAYPSITTEELTQFQDKSYADIFYHVTKKLLGTAIPDDVLRSTADEAYAPDNFDFDESDHNLRFTTLPSGIELVGLSDGPTGAFKDMAMQPFARWMDYLQSQTGNQLTILLSTSGDTGPAALKAFGGLPNLEIINMLPREGVSPFQWSQMAEVADDPGIHVLEVAGDFSYINDLHMEADLAYDLGAVNSVNIARIVAQVPYYIAAYVKASTRAGQSVGSPVDVSVPSGNFGNGLSAIIARTMGVPFRRIIIATNENNTLDRLISTGIFELSEFQHTNSSAQDVRMPSNIWRYFAMAYNNDPEKISRIYQTLQKDGSVALQDIGPVDPELSKDLLSTTITASERRQTMQDVFAASGQAIVIDPHTANGIAAIDKLDAHDSSVPMLAMETAKPFKFDAAIEEALGLTPERPERFKDLEQKMTGKALTQIAGGAELLAYLDSQTKATRKTR